MNEMLFQLAHAGHWLVQVVYFVPVLGFIVWLVVTQIKDRRRGDDDEEGGSPTG
jgi:hypothetical protein